MILVIDASVALKRFFKEQPDEPDVSPAVDILGGIDNDQVQRVQPPRFFAGVAAVFARKDPANAAESLDNLWRIKWRGRGVCRHLFVGDGSLYPLTASPIRHLYHATALSIPDAKLVAADGRYYEKAYGQGRISWLADSFP